jgi:Gly-Xaa carboxypeptidase
MGEKSDRRYGNLNEGQLLPHSRSRPRQHKWKETLLGVFTGVLIILAAYSYVHEKFIKPELETRKYKKPQCPPQEVIGPKSHPEITERDVEKLFKSEAFKKLSAERLSGAVQIPTEDFDDMGPVEEDKRWDVFYDLEAYFKKTFPLL